MSLCVGLRDGGYNGIIEKLLECLKGKQFVAQGGLHYNPTKTTHPAQAHQD